MALDNNTLVLSWSAGSIVQYKPSICWFSIPCAGCAPILRYIYVQIQDTFMFKFIFKTLVIELTTSSHYSGLTLTLVDFAQGVCRHLCGAIFRVLICQSLRPISFHSLI